MRCHMIDTVIVDNSPKLKLKDKLHIQHRVAKVLVLLLTFGYSPIMCDGKPSPTSFSGNVLGRGRKREREKEK